MDQADEKSVIHTPHDAGCGCFLVEGYVSYIEQCVYKTHVDASACRYPALLRERDRQDEYLLQLNECVSELERERDEAVNQMNRATHQNVTLAKELVELKRLDGERKIIAVELEELHQELAQVKFDLAAVKAERDLARDLHEAVIQSVVSTIEGVDYEGFPTSELNYLQRLRILVKKEAAHDEAVRKIRGAWIDARLNGGDADKVQWLGFALDALGAKEAGE